MRITDVEIITFKPTKQAIVKVYTDEGIVGVGSISSHPQVAKAIIEAEPGHSPPGPVSTGGVITATGLKHLIVGEDPLEVERIWEKMYRGSIWYGYRGAAIHAISGIDTALWDIAGKAMKVPVNKLLGSRYRDKVRAYASCVIGDPREVEKKLVSYIEKGFKAVKLGWGPFGESFESDVELVKRARDAVGDEVELMIDIGRKWTASAAIRRIRKLERYDLFFIEEPLPPDDLEGYARLVRSVDTPIATGELYSTRYSFRELIERQAADVLQPDIDRAGGISECRKIALMANMRNLLCIPHSWSTAINIAASLHLVSSIPNGQFVEYEVEHNPLISELLVEPIKVKDGLIEVPNKPGLGIELDEEAVAKYAQERLW
jgi:L-alanine-DL-glutamate epimerase-like enolase superfamily enzyme